MSAREGRATPCERATPRAGRPAGIRRSLGTLAVALVTAACAGHGPRPEAFTAGSEAERLRAIAAISGSAEATDEVVAALDTSLEDPSAAVRWEAAGALGRIGPRAARALPALERCAQGRQDALALRCAQAATGIGPLALPGLRALLASPDPAARRRGALALTGLGPAAAPAADDLISLLGDADPAISAAAKDALVAIGPPALRPLLETIRGQNTYSTSLRSAALAAIDAMKPYPGPLLLELLARGGGDSIWAARQIRLQEMEADALPVLIRIAGERWWNTTWAVSVFSVLGDKAAPVIPALVARLDNSGGAALAALCAMGAAAMPVAEQLLAAEAEQSRIQGIRILGAMRPLPVTRLLELAHGDDETLRGWATEYLGRAQDVDVSTLLVLSRDEDPKIKRTAVHHLEGVSAMSDSEIQEVRLLLLADADKWIRASAARALGQIRPAPRHATSALVQALADPEKEVRDAAVASLARMSEEDLPALLDAFRNEDGEARAAVLAVFSIRRAEALVTDVLERGLRSRLGEDDPAVRTGAALALLTVGRGGPQEVTIATSVLRSSDETLVRLALGALRDAGSVAAAALPPLLESGSGASEPLSGEYLKTQASVGRRDPSLIPVYIDALRRGVGAEAARAGMEWFNDDAIAPLVNLLQEQDVKGMPELEKAILGHGQGAVPALEALLRGDATAVRRAAALLCRLDRVTPQAVDVFLDVLRQDASSEWQQALACLEMAGPALAPHADFLMGLYARIDTPEKVHVMQALAACGEAARPFVPVLIAALEAHGGLAEDPKARRWQRTEARQEQERLRYAAIEAVGRLGAVAADAVPALTRLAAVPSGKRESSQLPAIAALGRIGPAAHAAIPALLPFLDDPGRLGDGAWEALTAMAAPPDILAPRCLTLLRTAQQGQRLRHALRYLIDLRYEDPAFLPLLEQLAQGETLAFEATQELRRRRPPAGGPPLDAPVLLTPALLRHGVELKWGPGVPKATGYRLYRREEPDGDWDLLQEVAPPGFTDRAIEPGTSYAYRAEAFTADRDGRSSNVQRIAIEGTAIREQLAPPTGLTVETALVRRGDRDVRVARLAWEAPRGWACAGYVIFRGLTGSNQFATVAVTRSTSFVDEKINADFSLSYFVRGIDAALRKSEASNEAVAAAAARDR
ncbi:MAG TPA: HEAT repeat domain-containing protein [bacterium]